MVKLGCPSKSPLHSLQDMARPRTPFLARWTLIVGLGALGLGLGLPPGAKDIPRHLGDTEFWRLVTNLSEPGGYFRSDNFVSNESSFQQVVPDLQHGLQPGGVYLGVGPDQNFTYIVALRPRISFIFDIRRQNLLELLLYKALIEQAGDRAEFLSLLFARPRPTGLDSTSKADSLFAAYGRVAADSALFRATLSAVQERLLKRHGFKLSADDLEKIIYVYRAFFTQGPELSYSFSSPPRWGYGRMMPTYAELMRETDGQGGQRSYLATEVNFRILKELEQDNLIVPLVGDFAGPKTIRGVSRYLKERGATVTAFYTSNVEQYLFRQGDDWRKFFENVATLPVDPGSVFIRAVFNYGGRWDYQNPSPGPRSLTLLCPIAHQLLAFSEGRIQSYYDVVEMSSGVR
jgi:hypothetical protein